MIKDIDTYIKEHTHTCYCEAIILTDGRIVDAVPSHIYKLISLTDKSKEDIDSIMPASASPLDWLVSYMNFVAVWYNSFKFGSLTDEQKNSLQKLVNSGVLSNNITGVSTDEYYRCKYLDDYAKGLIDVIPLEEREFYTVRKEGVL